jgi:hypothetical protein
MIERRRRKRIYDLDEKINESFVEMRDIPLTERTIVHLERLARLEIKTDILLDMTHDWRRREF